MIGIFIGLYWLFFFDSLVGRAGDNTWFDLAIGALAILLVLDATRRVVGVPDHDYRLVLFALCTFRTDHARFSQTWRNHI